MRIAETGLRCTHVASIPVGASSIARDAALIPEHILKRFLQGHIHVFHRDRQP